MLVLRDRMFSNCRDFDLKVGEGKVIPVLN